ncbi:MAG: hypothetical protein LBO20_10735, partial [Bifidobacteriaceae bacterium]|nr:hypothetical protein [Bifidobacteriaceae bacterium]
GTPNVLYMYIQSCVVNAACFADRAGDGETAGRLRELAVNPPGEPYKPRPESLDGSRLNNLFDQAEHDPNTYVGWAFGDISRLARMWVYGSTSWRWSKKKIGRAIDHNVAGIHSLKRWQPW